MTWPLCSLLLVSSHHVLDVFVPPQVCGKRQKFRSSLSDGLHELTLEQKLYVAQRAVAETKQDQKKLKQRYERIQDNYKVQTHPCTGTTLKETQVKSKCTLTAHFLISRHL